jgi:protein-glucosylgalactosylhydroxylysine glucosidase
LSDALQQTKAIDQAYDFSCGELTSRVEFPTGDIRAQIEILTFCDRAEPTLICQEVTIELSAACDVVLRAMVDASTIDGRASCQMRDTPGGANPACDGALLWESAGGLSTCGVAYVTELLGAGEIEPDRPPFSASGLASCYSFRARSGRRYRLRQVVSVVPSQLHSQPDQQAIRLLALARCAGSRRSAPQTARSGRIYGRDAFVSSARANGGKAWPMRPFST